MNKLACALFVAAAATSVQVQHVDGLSSQGNYLSQLQPTVSGELHLESINDAVRTGAQQQPQDGGTLDTATMGRDKMKLLDDLLGGTSRDDINTDSITMGRDKMPLLNDLLGGKSRDDINTESITMGRDKMELLDDLLDSKLHGDMTSMGREKMKLLDDMLDGKVRFDEVTMGRDKMKVLGDLLGGKTRDDINTDSITMGRNKMAALNDMLDGKVRDETNTMGRDKMSMLDDLLGGSKSRQPSNVPGAPAVRSSQNAYVATAPAAAAPVPAAAAPAAVAWAPPVAAAPPAAFAAAGAAGDYGIYDDQLFDMAAKQAVYGQWDPNTPRSPVNFNPFETWDGNSPDASGFYPGERRYKDPKRGDVSYAIMQTEQATLDEIKANPKPGSVPGAPGCRN